MDFFWIFGRFHVKNEFLIKIAWFHEKNQSFLWDYSSHARLLLVKDIRMLLLPNRAGNNKIITLQEEKFFPLRPLAARERK